MLCYKTMAYKKNNFRIQNNNFKSINNLKCSVVSDEKLK